MARKLKKNDEITFVHGGGEFTPGCRYTVEKVSKGNIAQVIDDEGNFVEIDFPLDPKCGLFE